MGDLKEFPLTIRLFLKGYPWRRIDPVPWTPLEKPLSQCRLALVSTAGFVLPGQTPFDNTMKGGDWSYREIPRDTALQDFQEYHRSKSFDHHGIQADPNLALPLDRAKEMAAAEQIGSVNHRHLSFMGSLTAPGRLVQRSAPEAAQLLVKDEVDVALLTPV